MSVLEQVIGAENMKYFAQIRKQLTAAPSFPSEAIGQTGVIDANPLRMLQTLVTRKNPYEKTTEKP